MRIGHFAHEIWAPGGIASFIRRLGDAQQRRGNSVSYFSYPSSFADEREHVTVANLDELYSEAHALDILHVHQEVAQIDTAPVPVLRSMHENQATCPSGSRYLRERGRPCDRHAGPLVCAWGLMVDRCGSIKPGSVATYYKRYRADQRVVPAIQTHTVSEFLRRKMIEAGYPSSRIHTLLHPAPEAHSATPPVSPPPEEGLARFLFVGRVVPSKGVQWLLHAAAMSRSQFEIDIAGDGYYLESTRELARKLGIADRVRFHGWVEPAGILELMSSCRAVVFPSLWHEPAGLVTVEAAARGRAVIASCVGGIPEYADPGFSRLIEPNNVQDLADTLDEFTRNRELATRMGERGPTLVNARFSPDVFLDRMDDLYQLTIRDYQSKPK